MDQIYKFTLHEVFFEYLSKEEFLIESLRQSITMYPQNIEKLIRLSPLIFPEGFALQKGSLFGCLAHMLMMIIKRFLRFTNPIVNSWKNKIKVYMSITLVKKEMLAVLTMLPL